MMTRVLGLLSLMLVCAAQPIAAQSPEAVPPKRDWFIGSSGFILANAVSEDHPSFYQLNVGRWLTPANSLSLEVMTWRYTRPLATPLGGSGVTDANRYPGSVRGTGAGLAFQRRLWRGLYAAGHATALRQQYRDLAGQPIQHGFQLFLTGRLGYHFEVLHGRLFVEPSMAVTSWPIDTNVPAPFKTINARWRSYFIGEPGLHFGVRF